MQIVEFVFNILVYILNTVIVLFAKVLGFIIGVLPTSPFLSVQSSLLSGEGIGKYIQYLAWLLPIKNMVIIIGTWLSAMIIYYCYSVVMRWIKLID